jgi:putative membrane protein
VQEAREPDVDPRFSLANERTFLAWIRTALAMIVAGAVAAKGLHFNHEVARWTIATPPIAIGALVALDSHRRWRSYEVAMQEGRALAPGRALGALAVAIAVYAVIVLVVTALDG